MKNTSKLLGWASPGWLAILLIAGVSAPLTIRSSDTASRRTAPPKVAGVTNSFYAVTPHLDSGGCFYLYLDTAHWLEGLSGKVAGWQQLFTSLPNLSESDQTAIRQVFHFITRLIQTSGVEEISGFGASGVLRENNLYYSKFMMHHYPGRGAGMLWSMFGTQPHSLETLEFLPTSTALASGADMDLVGLWDLIQREVEQADVPRVSAVLRQFTTHFEAQAGLPFRELLASTPGPFLFTLDLDETRQVSLTPLVGATLEIPEPSLGVMFRTKGDSLFQLVERTFPEEAQLVRVDQPGLKMRTMPLPVPLPMPVRPTVAQAGDLFFFTTHERLVEAMLAVKEGKQAGLKTTEEFKSLSMDIPLEGNSYSFQSHRFGLILGQVVRAALSAASKGAVPTGGLMEKILAQEQVAFTVSRNTPEGWLMTANGSEHPASLILAPALVLPTSVAAGMLMPALAKAKAKAQRVSCVSNLKQLGLAALMYANDHEDVFPKDFLAMQEFIVLPKVLFCPADPDRPDPLPTKWPQVDPDTISYEFLIPSEKVGDNAAERAAFRCPIHGNVCYADGHVEQGRD